jgi:hypothetical protein
MKDMFTIEGALARSLDRHLVLQDLRKFGVKSGNGVTTYAGDFEACVDVEREFGRLGWKMKTIRKRNGVCLVQAVCAETGEQYYRYVFMLKRDAIRLKNRELQQSGYVRDNDVFRWSDSNQRKAS